MTKSLMIWNGMPGEKPSGGDNYVIKLIKLSNLKPDLLSPTTAKNLVAEDISQHYKISSSNTDNFFIIFFIYLIRIIQAIYISLTNKKQYDLAITSSPFFFDILPLALSKSSRKVVILYHVIPQRKAKNLKTKIRFTIANIEKAISFSLIRKHVDTIITGNEVEKQKLKSIFPNKKIIIADAGFDTQIINKQPKQKKDPNAITFAGRLTTQKGIFDLVTIMKSLSKTHPKLKLTILGDGPDRKEFEQKIKQAKLNNIQLKGFVSEEEKYKTLNKSKYFFFPSYEEGWGISLAEALYTENICFTYKLPHYPSIFTNHPIYIKTGNTKEFINQFQQKQTSFKKPKAIHEKIRRQNSYK